jgi:predicted amidophosphoribosyltransferase
MRRENVKGAFAPVGEGLLPLLQGRYPGRTVLGRHVLLVDDVLSTGATVDHCGRALLAAGACKVTVAVAAT